MPRKKLNPSLSGVPVSNEAGRKNLKRSEFADKLQGLIHQKNISQSELATAIKVGRDSISTYCSGKTLPGPRIRQKIAAYFGIDPSELVPAAEPARQRSFSQEDLGESKTHLFVNMIVGTNTALWIQLLLRDGMTPQKLASMNENLTTAPNTTSSRKPPKGWGGMEGGDENGADA